jgi:hypothetical protein
MSDPVQNSTSSSTEENSTDPKQNSTIEVNQQPKTFSCIHDGERYGSVIANTPDAAANKLYTLISKNKKNKK